MGSHARVEFAPMTESKNNSSSQEVLAELKRGVEEMLLEEELLEEELLEEELMEELMEEEERLFLVPLYISATPMCMD